MGGSFSSFVIAREGGRSLLVMWIGVDWHRARPGRGRGFVTLADQAQIL
jgi:hypothetical protein